MAMGIEKSRPVLITGCSTGIGRATAERLAEDGWNVHATARRPEAIEDLARKGCKINALDVTDERSMELAVEEVEKDGPIGALINNAGYSQSGAVETIPMDSVRRQFETNVFGLMRMCQLALPSMRGAGSGRIVNLSSMGGKLTFPGGGVYHATKHAVEALSDALRFEVQEFGIQVVIIEPGLIITDFGETAAGSINDVTEHGPYATFNAEVGRVTANAYTGSMARFGAGPEAVAGKISSALTARRPATRYKVTPSARLIMGMRRVMTDRMWDRFVRSQYPPPKPEV
jgi:NAD(P)-dependent dehydrogenase (short-subunit alcohol dehydrogenase family)